MCLKGGAHWKHAESEKRMQGSRCLWKMRVCVLNLVALVSEMVNNQMTEHGLHGLDGFSRICAFDFYYFLSVIRENYSFEFSGFTEI